MVRTIITPTQTDIQISIAKEYVGKPIEITYLALDELENKPNPKSMADFFGILSEGTYQELKKHTEQARSEWNRIF